MRKDQLVCEVCGCHEFQESATSSADTKAYVCAECNEGRVVIRTMSVDTIRFFVEKVDRLTEEEKPDRAE
jgi:hypothetical protein